MVEKTALEIKKKKLKEELARPEKAQNKEIIKRLKQSIKRHKQIGKIRQHKRIRSKRRQYGKRKTFK